jgi:hypothetical protein
MLITVEPPFAPTFTTCTPEPHPILILVVLEPIFSASLESIEELLMETEPICANPVMFREDAVTFARVERPETVRDDASALPMEEDEEVREETTREEAFTPTRVVFPPMNK